MRDVFGGIRRMLATAWRASPAKTLTAVVLMLTGSAAAPLIAVTLAWMTNEVVTRHAGRAMLAGACVAMLAIFTATFDHLAHISYFELAELAEVDYDDELIALSNGSPGIAHHEQPQHVDTLSMLKREGRQFSMRLEALLRGMGLAVAMVLTAILLARLAPVLLLMPLAAVPPLLAGRWAERIVDNAKMATAEQSRIALSLFTLCTTAGSAGELRVFRLEEEVRRRHGQLWGAVMRAQFRADLAATWLRAGGQLVFAAAYIAAVLLVVRDAVVGRRSVGDVILVLTLAAQVNQQVSMAVGLLQDMQRMASMYRRLTRFRSAVAANGHVPVDQAPPDRLWHGIELAGVTFTYPGTDTPVLRDVQLKLPAGATVALVGENGAGKTTMVKLLCGLYRPTDGQIKIDGVDLRRMPVEQWRERVSTGFQDFVRYEFRVRHAVGVGGLDQIDSADAVAAAMDRAHASDVLAQLASGLETQLGRSYNDGVELSGGQWQKIALSRALMREAPLLLVLDEPTSALDAETEHALFERYASQVKQVASATGGITVLVSHRFSTVRMADLILVLAGGRVVEFGDHDTLTAGGGLYAELFALHAKAYA
jgi:ATP-binding cassette subfamily B protein